MAITYHGRLVYNRGFGLANTATQDSVYPNSIFRIASVSKPVTATACMKLFEEGILHLDAKVFGPNGILNDSVYLNILDSRDTDITVRMLLQHSAGWNRDISGDPMFDAYNIASTMGVTSPPAPGVVVQYMLSQKMLDFTPGTQSHYSNFGFCVLGRVIEKLTGQSYENYVRDSVLIPLQITDMKLGFNLESNQLPMEVNYYDYPGAPLHPSVYDNSTMVPMPYGGFNVEFMDAHGGWVASCEDLLKLVCAIDGFNSRPDFLNASTIDTMTKPSINDPSYACGIGVNVNGNWWHLGSLPGTSSEFVRFGNDQINWAILLNTRDQNNAIANAMDVLVWNTLPSITSWPDFDLFPPAGTGVREHTNDRSDFILYPNPAQDKVTVLFTGFKPDKSKIHLYNILGQELFVKSYTSGNKSLTIDCSQLSPGIYFIKINTDNQETIVKKIMIR